MLELQELAKGEQSYNLATKLNWLKIFRLVLIEKTVSVCFTISHYHWNYCKDFKTFSPFVDFLNGENYTLTSETKIETSLLDKRPSLNRVDAGKLVTCTPAQ